ncbi:zinc phosphodiesterase ELAC 2-like isoform X1 [Olea europaea subsp. europaea]|uniref:Zinc phosphodiesterase ELAC 2-like isoform X1 n=1 Tax=Olea europaea subsp. europaea TaxID=158383 RepID=A0A8S0RRZ5_OLEEU|nr:zinc phosphodiesterase ELAC 2-like isoform X1 [Olea europaea subsp. europaea]
MDKITSSVSRSCESVRFNKKRSEGGDDNHRPNKKFEVSKLDPMNTVSYVQIFGNGMDTQDTSLSVLLFFDKERFIFNVGEVHPMDVLGPSVPAPLVLIMD